ncbi:hypothetical protein F5141DRAFT_1065254 [Pisolithus sp. B1]|nr:hypothetical protein F5141DRAFT_1065254 [Pisolithus sp. B1]
MYTDHLHCLPVVLVFIGICEQSHGRWWWMHADHVHCLPVALGFIDWSEWSHGRWWWMQADHVHCLPVALGFTAWSECGHGKWWWMDVDRVHLLPVAFGFIGRSEWNHGRWCWMHVYLVHCLPVALGFIGNACILNTLYSCLWFSPQVPQISTPRKSLKIPTFSSSMQYSRQSIAENGIGVILVLEYLYFLLQVKTGKPDIQKDLNLAVEKYKSSGIHAKVNVLIQAAFEKHGDDTEILCPTLVEIAQLNQLCKVLFPLWSSNSHYCIQQRY